MDNKDIQGIKGWTEINVFDEDGILKNTYTNKNLVVSAGKAAVAANVVSDVTGTKFDYIAIGTGTTAAAATDTQLVTEITGGGGQRRGTTDVTGTRITTSTANDTGQWVTTFTFTANYAVTEAGLLNASSNGDLLCRQTFSAINVVDGDSLQLTWKVQFS